MRIEPTPGALRPIGSLELDRAVAMAMESPRGRAILRYHAHDEGVQRMLNALRPHSYVRPHRHRSPAKVETFLALRGAALVLRFDDEGRVAEQIRIGAGEPVQGAEIPPGLWHAVLVLDDPTVLYEVIQGPFDPQTHKEFAPWAPEEGSPEAEGWWAALRAERAP